MIANRKIFIAFLMGIVLCLAWARPGFAAELCKVVSPRRLARLHSFPVPLTVEFGRGARPATFMALLNGVDITGKFIETENGMQALVGPEDGLLIDVNKDVPQKMNVLKTGVEGLQPQQRLDLEIPFFVEVDRLMAVGPEGGALQSLDGRLLVDIPPHALPASTTIALTGVYDSGQIEAIYQLAPDNASLDRPVTVTMKYDPADLPPGVREEALFLVSGNEFPEKLKNVFVDKPARTVRAASMSFSKVVMSYYMKIGKKLSDIAPAAGFRLPIGDNSDPFYSCGLDYQTPSANDLGEILPLLQRSSSAEFDYPSIIFNEKGANNSWHVRTAFNLNRHINPGSGSAGEWGFLYPADETIFSNAEDWYFSGQRLDHQRFPVHAVADGLIIYNDPSYGNAIVMAHRLPAGPILSVYSHLEEKSLCPVGSVIHKGNVIGTIGRDGGAPPYLHFEIGRQSLVKVDAETGEIMVPSSWFGQWMQDEVYENYYDPTNFLFNIMGKYKWDFNVNGNDEGWTAENVKNYENGYPIQVKDGLLSVRPESGVLLLTSYPLNLEAAFFDSVFVRMRSNGFSGQGKVYFVTDEGPAYSEEKEVAFDIRNDDQFHEYRVYMAGNRDWQGTIVGIRLAFSDPAFGEATAVMNFDSIRLGRAYLAPTPDTGLTHCYDNNREIACPAPDEPFYGQDAHYAINPPNYEMKTINGDEVLIDHITGLTWQGDNDGTKRTWYEAMDYCDNLSLAGFSDWRRPTRKELQSIANYGSLTPNPAVKLAKVGYVYTAAPDDCYWSATTQSFLFPSALKACSHNNLITLSDKSEKNYVRAVRGRPLEFGHFLDNGDGTVTDITTGLMWMQTETRAMTWEKALAFCENLAFAGFRDWRLPTIQELSRLVDDSRQEPSIDTAYFPGCRPSVYWSSTTHALYPDTAWYVRFDDGQVQGSYKGRRHYVRPVRGGFRVSSEFLH